MTAQPVIKSAYLIALSLLLNFASRGQLTANFTGTPTSGCSPLVVNFADQSQGSPNQWKWDLGNGTISFLQNPSATYFVPGSYTVKLVIHNAANNADSVTKIQYITVYSSPTVNFTGSPLTGCFPLPVQFSDQSIAGSGSINLRQWDFGDGNLSNAQNPAHTYLSSGNFNVSLRVRNSFGCLKTLSKPQYVQISTGVHADFTNNTSGSCSPPAIINFQNLSTGTGTLNYQWNFGDGGTSILINPTHTYATAGSYTVRLIVTNQSGCTDTLTKINAITVGAVHAAFTSPDSVCVNNAISFTNTSIPAPASSSWDFGDGTLSGNTNPVKLYSAAGNYLVKLVANFGACTDSAFKTIVVLSKPTAAFTGTPLVSCSAPLTVNFNNQSTGGISYNWLFGDGISSTLVNPVHLYSATGIYDVTLIVSNAFGCSDTLVRSAYVKVEPPQITFNNLPDSGCAPFTHIFSATIVSPDPVVSYLWDFGDGTTSNLPSPIHIFNTGIYTIRLIITTAGGCSDTMTMTRGIVASTKPTSDFSATPRDACANTPINFTDLSTGNVTNWLWNFGDGGTSTSQNPSHVYQDTGYFDVQLIVWNGGCADTLKLVRYIHINPPIAIFTVTFICGNPRNRIFTDQSIGADTWSWDFGDGTGSTIANPVHLYAAAGTYTVSLTVHNNTTGCDYTRTQTIKVVIELANFTASDTVICKNSTIIFTPNGNVAANVASYSWDFGDGSTGTGSPSSHVYTLSGKYTVKLVITDILGCTDTLIRPLYIEVDGPTAHFASSVPGSCLQSNIIFTDSSTTDGTHPIVKWVWNYGDGVIDTLTSAPFQHSYLLPGNYIVTLKVTNSKGCTDSFSLVNPLVISRPQALFSTQDTMSCPNQAIVFSNFSTGPSLSYTWYFGDGSTSTAAIPTHTYSANGIFTVKLVVTDQYGCTDSLIKPAYITIVTPHADFNMSDSVSSCPPLIVSFNNTSTNYTSLNWDFGDGSSTQVINPSHFYATAGTFIITLTITSPGGCTDIKQRQLTVRGPRGTFTYGPLTGCNPVQVSFTATTQDRLSLIWDYNDGNIYATTDSVVSHLYTSPGRYVPKLILIDANGCQVPITGPDTIRVNGITARFHFASQALCNSGTVQFFDSTVSNDVIVSYSWNFGDGTFSALQNPNHYYATAGQYFPVLTVRTLGGCVDSFRTTIPVKVVSSPQISLTNTPNGCTPLSVLFNGNLIIPDTSAISWNWVFGNGNVSGLQNPPTQLYSIAGIYNVQLIAANSSGCKDTATTIINAYALPAINAGVDTMICKGTGITLHATGGVNYVWSPSAGLSCNNCANPVAMPDSATNYLLTGTSAQGCVNTANIMVKVKYPFTMITSPGDTLCKGNTVRLFATGAYTYSWSPASGLNSTTSSTPIASPSSSTIYKVIGTDDHGCFRDTGYVSVKVFPIPTVDAGADKTINAGQMVDLVPIISPDVTTVLWSPTGSIFRNSYPAITVKPMGTTEYTVVVKNNGGCTAKDKVTIFVICNGANVFIPNTFSPNGDGVNDVFYPRGNGLFNIKTLRVFNRWGEVVFEKNSFTPNDASAGWDGTYKGIKLSPDVYVYTLDILCDNSSVLTFKGNIALIR